MHYVGEKVDLTFAVTLNNGASIESASLLLSFFLTFRLSSSLLSLSFFRVQGFSLPHLFL